MSVEREKRVRCPDPKCACQHVVMATGAKRKAQYTRDDTTVWMLAVCEQCSKPFEFTADYGDTRTRPHVER